MKLAADFARVYRLSTLSLTAAGFFALLLTGHFFGFLWVAVAAAMSLSYLLRSGVIILSHRLATAGGALGLGAILVDLLLLSAGLPTVTYVGLALLYLQLALLFAPESDRIYRLAAVLSFFHMIAAAALTTSIVYLLASILYVLASTWVLILHQIKAGSDRVSTYADNQWRGVLSSPLISRASVVALVVFSLTAAFFFVIPRYGAGYFFSRGDEVQTVSGFTQEVRLGQLNEIKQSTRIAMRVALPGFTSPPPVPLYWRGISLESYDGSSWSHAKDRVHKLTPDDRGFRNRDFDLTMGLAVRTSGPEVQQEFFLNPPNTTVAFAIPGLQKIRGKFSDLTVDHNGSVRIEFPAFSSNYYEAWSTLAMLTPAQLRSDENRPVPSWILDDSLQLPGPLPRIQALARRVVGGAVTTYDRARAIERFLADEYAYATDPTGIDPQDPLGSFLFERKAGHCEFFSSAMAIMLRTLGEPARIANGYQQGEWNDLGSYFIVRESDAHSWTEVFFPTYGWITFDPTPSAGRSSYQGPDWTSRVRKLWDNVRMIWKRRIIEYDLLDQIDYLRGLGRFLRGLGRRMASSYGELQRILVALAEGDLSVLSATKETRNGLFAGMILFGVPWLVYLARKRLWSVASRRRALDPVGFYKRLLALLEAHGHSRPPARTPMEFVSGLAREHGDLYRPAMEVTRTYYLARFAGRPLTEAEAVRAVELIDELAAGLEAGLRGTARPREPGARRPPS